MQGPIDGFGRFATAQGRKYLAQLCKHFGHKVPATVDPDGAAGRVQFAMGTAQFRADDAALTVQLRAGTAAGLQQMREVVDDHLRRFAFREGFEAMTWAPAAA